MIVVIVVALIMLAVLGLLLHDAIKLIMESRRG